MTFPVLPKTRAAAMLIAVAGSSFITTAFSQPHMGEATCYLSRQYQAGVQDVLKVEEMGRSNVTLIFGTIYCNYEDSPDCASGRPELIVAKGRRHGNTMMVQTDAGPTCTFSVRSSRSGRLYVSQTSDCPGIKYWGPHGIYTKSDDFAVCAKL